MKKTYLILSFILAALFSNAQEAENAAMVTNDDPLRKYVRSSITHVFIDNGESLSGRLIGHLKDATIPKKFNDNSIRDRIFKLNTTEALENVLATDVAKEIVRIWFPYDSEKQQHSYEVFQERGLYNATDAEVIAAKASMRGIDLLKDAGVELIGRSYIVVYEPCNVKPYYDEKYNKKTGETTIVKGFSSDCKLHIYLLDWTPEVQERFLGDEQQLKNPNFITEFDFSVKNVLTISDISAIGGHVVNPKKQVSEESDLKDLANQIIETAYEKMTEKIEDFKVKAPIFSVSPITAKIGTKEGVTVDQRYFVFEVELDEAGKQAPKRKGVVRATGKIAQNDSVATGKSPTTQFYQTYGKKLDVGMLLQQKPDLGIGISALAGNDFSVLLEYNASMGLGLLAKNSLPFLKAIPYGMKVYIKYTQPFGAMKNGVNDNNLKISSKDGKSQDVTWGLFNIGISKDVNFARYLSVTPYLGFVTFLVPEDYSDAFEAYCKAIKKSASGIDAGIRLNVAVLHNIQVMGNVGYNTVKSTWYSNGMTFGIGAKYQF